MQTKTTLALAASLAVTGLTFGGVADARAQQANDPQVQKAREAEQAADRAAERAERVEERTDRTAERAEDRAEARQEAKEDARERAAEAREDARDAAQVRQAAVKFPAGIKAAPDANDVGDVRNTLDSITKAALTEDGFDDLVERLVDQDRNRIGQNDFTDQKFADLNAKAAQLRQAYRAKYGADFTIAPEKAFSMVPVVQGEIDDPKVVAGNWPIKAAMTAGGGAAAPAAGEAQTAGAAQAGKSEAGLDSNVEAGRNVAVATFPKSHGLPALNVSLMKELGGYRVDVPNTVTGQQLKDNLSKHLDHLIQGADQWPKEAWQAQTAIAHHILAGVYGVEGMAQQDKAAGQRDTAARQPQP